MIKDDLPYGFDDVRNDLGAAGRLYNLGDNALKFIDNLKVKRHHRQPAPPLPPPPLPPPPPPLPPPLPPLPLGPTSRRPCLLVLGTLSARWGRSLAVPRLASALLSSARLLSAAGAAMLGDEDSRQFMLDSFEGTWYEMNLFAD